MLLRKKHLRVACQVWKMLLASKFRQTTSSLKICCKFVVYKFCKKKKKKKNCQHLVLDLENVTLVWHSFIYKLFIAAVLNLGYAYPWGYVRKSQGVRQTLKMTQNKYIWVDLLIWGARKDDKILIWGYAEHYNPDLGVRAYQKVENPWFIVKSRKNFRLIKYFRFPTLTNFSFLTLLLLITGLVWLPPPINQPIKFSFWPKSNFFLLRNGKSLEWKFVIL